MWGRSHLPPATYGLLTGSDGLLEQIVEYLGALVDPPRGILLHLFVPRLQLVVLVGDVQGGQHCQAQRLYGLGALRNRPHLLIHELRQLADVFRVELPAHLVFLIVNRDADRALSSCHVVCLSHTLTRPSAPLRRGHRYYTLPPSPLGRGAGGEGRSNPLDALRLIIPQNRALSTTRSARRASQCGSALPRARGAAPGVPFPARPSPWNPPAWPPSTVPARARGRAFPPGPA